MNHESTSRPTFLQWLAEPQTLIGLSAVLLSVCGLFISLYETSLMRKEQRASVWPYVEVGVSFNTHSVHIRAQNNGVGPARVKTAALTYDGEVLDNWTALAFRLLEDSLGRVPDDPQIGIYQSLIGGRVLPEGSDSEAIFRIGMSSDEDSVSTDERVIMHRFYEDALDGRIDVRVCYCSVYDDCWISSLQYMVQRFQGQDGPVSAQPAESCDAVPQSGI